MLKKQIDAPKVNQVAPAPKFPDPFGMNFGVIVQPFSFLNAAPREPPKRARKICFSGPHQSSTTKPPPRREHDLQVLIKVQKNLDFEVLLEPHFGALGVIFMEIALQKLFQK